MFTMKSANEDAASYDNHKIKRFAKLVSQSSDKVYLRQAGGQNQENNEDYFDPFADGDSL